MHLQNYANCEYGTADLVVELWTMTVGAFTEGVRIIPAASARPFDLKQAIWTQTATNSTKSPNDMITMEYGKVLFMSTVA